MGIAKKRIHKILLNYKVIIILGFIILLSLSLYNYKNNQELKNTNKKLQTLISKTTKTPTTTPTPILITKPTPTATPSATPKPILSEYIFIALPHSGQVYSCKRTSENIVTEASLAIQKAINERDDCVNKSNYFEECSSKCNLPNGLYCGCRRDWAPECEDLINKVNNLRKDLTKVLEENCVYNQGGSQPLQPAP